MTDYGHKDSFAYAPGFQDAMRGLAKQQEGS